MRILYHWKLLGEDGGPYAAASMGMVVVAGVPLLAARLGGWTPAAGLPPSWALACSGVAILAAAAFWWLFTRRQDEMFTRIQAQAWGGAGLASSIVLVVWGVLNGIHMVAPIPPLAPLFLLIGWRALFWLAAVRRWL